MKIRWMQPSLGAGELAGVADVFRDGWPGAGPRVEAFKEEFGRFIGAPPGELIAVTSCTEALFHSVAALDLVPGDEVVVPTISYVGAAHAVAAAGGVVKLADVDAATLNPSVEHIAASLSPRTRAMILLHYGGRAGWIEAVARLARDRGIVMIEDAACALGATTPSGACGMIGDIGLWSFDSMKLLAAGDGGMIRVRDPQMRERIEQGVHLGGIRSGLAASTDRRRWWEMDPERIGRRSFMNDLTASIARVQLSRVPSFIELRRCVAARYDAHFAGTDGIGLPPSADGGDVPYFYWLSTPWRDEVAWALAAEGIYSSFRYWPLHRMALYRDGGAFPGAETAAQKTLLLPSHQGLVEAEIDAIASIVLRTVADRGR